MKKSAAYTWTFTVVVDQGKTILLFKVASVHQNNKFGLDAIECRAYSFQT